ncbi:hypothetical protein DXX93_17670 [Thalassotalea euphylliae]|uniref:Uncharacterized protein n=1 Tax=Thalassotalea euphylliae TaxID=1655234 RepID=A0A3E0TW36_9GAMM|nr:hypothetical protein [Thalassotalea euphylliae]REL28215.1 hypothetical protein DXX93_17670 [Thalassotalea euphylliae]
MIATAAKQPTICHQPAKAAENSDEDKTAIIIEAVSKISVMEGLTERFGNITIHLHSLGTSAYRIEWYSRMTGASTSLARIANKKYVVIKQWAKNKTLPTVSADFDSRKSAIMHFINNVDIINTPQDVTYEAKEFCLNLFTKQEKMMPIDNPNFPKLRLQGAIGKIVEVRCNSEKEVIAEGVLLQILGNKAELKITKRYALKKKKHIQTFMMQRVFLK